MSVVSWCSTYFCIVLSICFCTGYFIMVPLNLTCLHCLQHVFFEHLFNLYWHTDINMLWCYTINDKSTVWVSVLWLLLYMEPIDGKNHEFVRYVDKISCCPVFCMFCAFLAELSGFVFLQVNLSMTFFVCSICKCLFFEHLLNHNIDKISNHYFVLIVSNDTDCVDNRFFLLRVLYFFKIVMLLCFTSWYSNSYF